MIELESQMNFETLMRAAKNGDISLVSCKDAKGRKFDVVAVLAMSGPLLEDYTYIPFAIMVNPSLYPLFKKIKPPETLKGEWVWDDDD